MPLINFFRFFPKYIFGILIAKPIVYLLLGLNIFGREKIPHKGPAIILANHNSHLDGMVIMALFPIKLWHKVRPVGAVDYFFSSKLKKIISTYIIDVIPIVRDGSVPKQNLLEQCEKALINNNIVIIFPEGTRGEPERLGNLHKGFCHLSNKFPDVPIVPIFLHGLGKSLPKGEALLVPFFVDVIVNDVIYNQYNNSELLVEKIKDVFIENNNRFLNKDY